MKQEKILDLYSLNQYVETTKKIAAMARRFNIKPTDVIHATWTIAKDSVWSKLERDVKDRKEEIKKEKMLRGVVE